MLASITVYPRLQTFVGFSAFEEPMFSAPVNNTTQNANVNTIHDRFIVLIIKATTKIQKNCANSRFRELPFMFGSGESNPENSNLSGLNSDSTAVNRLL
jgi:hypothetical protein